MKDQEILVPEERIVKIADRSYTIGKLSLRQTIKLMGVITKSIISSQQKLKELQEKSKNNKTNTEDILTIIELLNPDEVSRLFSIILKENDMQFIDDNLGIDESLQIIIKLCELNNFTGIKQNFQKLLNLINPQKKVD